MLLFNSIAKINVVGRCRSNSATLAPQVDGKHVGTDPLVKGQKVKAPQRQGRDDTVTAAQKARLFGRGSLHEQAVVIDAGGGRSVTAVNGKLDNGILIMGHISLRVLWVVRTHKVTHRRVALAHPLGPLALKHVAPRHIQTRAGVNFLAKLTRTPHEKRVKADKQIAHVRRPIRVGANQLHAALERLVRVRVLVTIDGKNWCRVKRVWAGQPKLVVDGHHNSDTALKVGGMQTRGLGAGLGHRNATENVMEHARKKVVLIDLVAFVVKEVSFGLVGERTHAAVQDRHAKDGVDGVVAHVNSIVVIVGGVDLLNDWHRLDDLATRLFELGHVTAWGRSSTLGRCRLGARRGGVNRARHDTSKERQAKVFEKSGGKLEEKRQTFCLIYGKI